MKKFSNGWSGMDTKFGVKKTFPALPPWPICLINLYDDYDVPCAIKWKFIRLFDMFVEANFLGIPRFLFYFYSFKQLVMTWHARLKEKVSQSVTRRIRRKTSALIGGKLEETMEKMMENDGGTMHLKMGLTLAFPSIPLSLWNRKT